MRPGYALLSRALRWSRAGAVPVGEGLAEAGRGVVVGGSAEPGGVAVRAEQEGAQFRVGGAAGADEADSGGPISGRTADGARSRLASPSGFGGFGCGGFGCGFG